MKSLRWILCVLFITSLLTPGYALIVRSGDEIVVEENEVIDDDLIAFGQNVNIKGSVTGNLCAFASEVTVSGEVGGTIFSGAGKININVKGVKSIWAAGGNISITGDIDKNIILAGGKLCVCENTRVGKDLKAFGGVLKVDGDVQGAITGGVGTFTMTGSSGDVRVGADEVKIESSARISGDLSLESAAEPIIEEGAVITGETTYKKPEKRDKIDFSGLAPALAFFIMLIKIISFIAMIIVGVIIIAVAKRFVRRVMNTLIAKPWPSLGWGFLALIVIPAAVVILFIVLIGYPFAIFGIYVYTILFYLSSIFVGLAVGEKVIQLFKKEGEISPYISLILGLIILFVLGLIPILGFLVKLAVLLFGSGMVIVGFWDLIKEMRGKELI